MSQFTAPRPLNLHLRKPRNPLVVPALMRQAGRHGKPASGSSQRQTTQRELRQQILQLGTDKKLPSERSP